MKLLLILSLITLFLTNVQSSAQQQGVFRSYEGFELQSILATLTDINKPLECFLTCLDAKDLNCWILSYDRESGVCNLSNSGGNVSKDVVNTVHVLMERPSSYSHLKDQYLHIGSGLNDTSYHTQFINVTDSPDDCYGLCNLLYGPNCKAFTYGSGICSIPDQTGPERNLSDYTLRSSKLFNAFYMLPYRSYKTTTTVFLDDYSTLSDQRIRDGRIELQNETAFYEVPDLIVCYQLCLEVTESCPTFSYDATTKGCFFTTVNFHDDWTYMESRPGCTAYFIKDPDRWKLITKHLQYEGILPDDAFNQLGNYIEMAAKEDMSLGSSFVYNGYLKNQLIDYWEDLTSKYKVRLELRSGSDSLLKYFEYNAVGTSSTDWFSQENFLDSSYSDLSASGSIQAWRMGDSWRTFYISHNHNGCGNDGGWLAIMASQGYCSEWDHTAQFPAFLYSPGNNYTIWATRKSNFDVLLVYMSFS